MLRRGVRRAIGVVSFFVSLLVLPCTLRAEEPSSQALRDYDAKIVDELRQTAPAAVPAFEAANRARTEQQPEKAVELYRQVLAAAPNFSHARRRLCHELVDLGRRDEGIRECRQAAKDEKAANLAGLATALVDPDHGHTPDPAEIEEARRLSDRATELDPSDFFVWYARAQVAAAEHDLPMLVRATQKLEGGPADLLVNALLTHAALLLSTESGEPSPGELSEARALAERADKLIPNQPMPQVFLCRAAIAGNDAIELRRCTDRLKQIAPENPATYVYAHILAVVEGRWGDARRELERAKQLGLEEETYAGFSEQLDEARPFWVALIRPTLWTLGAWVGILVLLVAFGLVLSRLALREAERLPEQKSEKSGRAQGMTTHVKRAYAAVLWLCCAFYYFSIPLVVLAVIGMGAVLVIGMLMAGFISVKLIVIAGIVILVTLSALGKSFLVRPRDEDPGDRLDLEGEPRLAAVLHEVANKIQTRPVDSVFLTPGSQIAVFERGGLSRQIRGKAERCLILGVAVLEGMKQRELKAILAHEYGHFSNRDTAGGGFALAVRRSLTMFAVGLAEGGGATWLNPAWWFINGFHRVFLRISQGASRLQEVLADRFAAFAYGSEAFVRGLEHVVERSIRFDIHCDATIKEVVEQEQPLANLYRFTPQASPSAEEVDAAVREALEAEPSPFDSHPAVKDRIRWVRALAAEGEPDFDTSGDDDAWSLFQDRARVEADLTAQVRDRLAENLGVVVRPE